MSLSQNAQKIQEALAKQGATCTVVELSASTHTANDAATALGCEVAQIVKSLVFVTKTLKKPILVLASGSNRVNEKLISKEVGEKIEKADATFVKETTGFQIGGIPPLGHKQKIETYIDQDLLQWEKVWAAAGTPHAVFQVKSEDLQKLTEGKIIEIK